jgi:hypothetical protein
MKMKTSALITMLFISSSNAQQISNIVDLDFHEVNIANKYSWGLVGTPSTFSKSEIILKNNFSKLTSDFLQIQFLKSSNEGQMYIMCALFKIDKKSYFKIKRSNKMVGFVSTFSGSVMRPVKPIDIYKEIEKTKCHQLDG